MDLQLNGKVAVVTGGSKGIGLAITRAMVAEGVRVVAGARSEGPDLAELASAGNVHPVAVDLTAPDGPARLIDEAVRAFGGIDILVNNVGAAQVRLEGFLAVTDEDWANSLSVNFLSAVRTIRAALPHLLERTPATIVTVSSVNAFLPDPVVIDYSAAKAALSNLCKSLSKEFGPRGLRVNMVSPGPVETALWLAEGGVADTVARATGSAPSEVAKHAVADSATGRFTHPEEVADAVLLLASGRAGNITGADLVIDGGLIQTL